MGTTTKKCRSYVVRPAIPGYSQRDIHPHLAQMDLTIGSAVGEVVSDRGTEVVRAVKTKCVAGVLALGLLLAEKEKEQDGADVCWGRRRRLLGVLLVCWDADVCWSFVRFASSFQFFQRISNGACWGGSYGLPSGSGGKVHGFRERSWPPRPPIVDAAGTLYYSASAACGGAASRLERRRRQKLHRAPRTTSRPDTVSPCFLGFGDSGGG